MKKIVNKIKKFFKQFGLPVRVRNLNIPANDNYNELLTIKRLLNDTYLQNYLSNEKYQNSKRLNKHEFQIYSQNGEDGIIKEIFNRIGTTNKYFVEFGVGNGMENNTLSLLLEGWNGAWIEGDKNYIEVLKDKFKKFLTNSNLFVEQAFIDKNNIQNLFKDLNVPKDFDLLSIDIDGNDYWVWQAIKDYSPKVVIMEYNAHMGPSINWIMKYNSKHSWDGTAKFGASLKALEILADRKGYKLVGCNTFGVNAFFVRNDLIEDKFEAPYTSENHYELQKLYLQKTTGIMLDFDEFEQA